MWLGDTLVAMRTVGIYLIRELAKLKGLRECSCFPSHHCARHTLTFMLSP